MTEISGSNVLITGGASGIGRRMALKMAQRGATVVIWDINQQTLNKTLDELKARIGRKAIGYVCDVGDRKSVYDTADRVRSQIGPIDILINNAGVVSGDRFLDLADEKIERTFKINTLALFWTTKAFLPGMVQRNHGHLVTVASAGGLIGVAKLSDYSASKWAAVGFDESLRVELAQTAPDVKTTVVCPYYINTGMFDGVKTRFSFLLPILDEEAVAERVVRAVEKNRPRVIMPWMVYLVPLMRILPVALFDLITDLMGINASMDEFRGRR